MKLARLAAMREPRTGPTTHMVPSPSLAKVHCMKETFDLTNTILGNELRTWLIALGVALGTLAMLRVLVRVVIARIAKLTTKTDTVIDDLLIGAVHETKRVYLFILAIYAGSLVLELPQNVETLLERATVIASLVQGAIWLSKILMGWLDHYQQSQIEEDAAGVMTMNALGVIGRIALWSTVLLLTLENVGVDITALVAGLGIGGVAVALAVQNILGDLFGSLSIVLDKPFVIGDFIVVGDLMGSVEHIGIKTTRVRSISGEQLIFANGDLLGSRIRNYGRMYRRRIVFKLGVVYQTSAEQLEKIPEIIRNCIDKHEQVTFDRSHFANYGDFSLDFETVYYVERPEYNVYMDVQQAIYLDIYRRFADEGIEFAYPSQTLFVQNSASAA